MSEAELIEISQRFRKLEDACEAADAPLAGCQARHEATIEKWDALLDKPERYSEACRESNKAERLRDSIKEIRENCERALEDCRQDMVRMQEQLRRAGAVK